MHGQPVVVDWLLEQGAKVSTWAAHKAAFDGDQQLLARLVQNTWQLDTVGVVSWDSDLVAVQLWSPQHMDTSE